MNRIDVDLIIEGGTVVTVDADNRIIEGGAVAVKGREIVAVDRAEVVGRDYRAARVLDARTKVVMPGLIDTYGHAGHGMLKGVYHPKLGWPASQLYFHASTDRWWRAEGMLSCTERLRFGVTTGFTVVGATPSRMDSTIFAERQAEAAGEVGIRAVIGAGPPDIYIAHLPVPWSGALEEHGALVERPFSYEQTIRNTAAFIQKWHGGADGRVRVAIHVPYLFGRQASHPKIPFVYADEHVPAMIEKAEEIRDLADRFGVLVHTHAFKGAIQFGVDKFGRERVGRLLGRQVVIAHANGFSADEVQVLGEERVSIAVVAFTHENLLYGVCPMVELLRAGANVTISTDGTAPYASYDLFREISRGLWSQWIRFGTQQVLPAGKGIRMVTIDAARALGIDDLVGSLEPGKRADIITIDFDQPHLTPTVMLPTLLAYYVTGRDVEDVLVDGKILMEGGLIKTVDVAAVMETAREEAAKAYERSDMAPYLNLDESFWRVSSA